MVFICAVPAFCNKHYCRTQRFQCISTMDLDVDWYSYFICKSSAYYRESDALGNILCFWEIYSAK